MKPSAMSLLDRRIIEAEMLANIYRTLRAHHSRDHALALVQETIEQGAFQAGQAFSAQAPGKPDFAHFQTIVDVWRGTGALTLENVRAGDRSLCFHVTRCAYVAAYRDMGLPPELCSMISCCRDEPFARGYSPNIAMERPQTIGGGAKYCDFTFVWESGA